MGVFGGGTMGNEIGFDASAGRARVGGLWWLYISNLPKTYSVQIFFQGEDIKNLQYAPILYQVYRLANS